MQRRLLARLRDDERGATAIEFALVAPLLFALLFSGMEAGRYLWFAAALDHAVGDAARCAGLAGDLCAGEGAVASAIAETLHRLGVTLDVPEAAIDSSTAPCGTLLVVEQAYPSIVPGLSPALPHLRASACITSAV
jgi:Flp pilus assembly protein TadG